MHGAFLSGMREAANMLRAARRKGLISEEEKADMKFGNFSVLQENNSADGAERKCLLQVEIGGDDGALQLYGLVVESQAIELREMDGDVDRLKVLHQKYGVQLLGSKEFCSVAESLIDLIRSAKVESQMD